MAPLPWHSLKAHVDRRADAPFTALSLVSEVYEFDKKTSEWNHGRIHRQFFMPAEMAPAEFRKAATQQGALLILSEHEFYERFSMNEPDRDCVRFRCRAEQVWPVLNQVYRSLMAAPEVQPEDLKNDSEYSSLDRWLADYDGDYSFEEDLDQRSCQGCLGSCEPMASPPADPAADSDSDNDDDDRSVASEVSGSSRVKSRSSSLASTVDSDKSDVLDPAVEPEMARQLMAVSYGFFYLSTFAKEPVLKDLIPNGRYGAIRVDDKAIHRHGNLLGGLAS